MGAGGAAAAPYSRAANDECRICGGRFLFCVQCIRVI